MEKIRNIDDLSAEASLLNQYLVKSMQYTRIEVGLIRLNEKIEWDDSARVTGCR